MEAREILKTSVVTLRYHKQYKLVYLTWHSKGGLSLQAYKEPFEFLAERSDLPVLGILSDNRNQGIVGTQLRSWLQKVGTPKAVARGLKCYFAVIDGNVFKKYYINTIFKLLEGKGLELKAFQDFDEAERGIKTAVSKFL